MDLQALKKWIKATAESEDSGLCLMYDMVFVANKDLIGNWLLKALTKKLDKRDKYILKLPSAKVNQMLITLREAQDRHFELNKTTKRFSQCGSSDEVQAPHVDECPNCGQHFETQITEQNHKCNGGPCKNGNDQNHHLKENQGVKPKENTYFCSWKNCNQQRFESKEEWRAHNLRHREEKPPTTLNQQSNSNLNQQSNIFENGAGVANKAKNNRKRQKSSSSTPTYNSSDDEEYNPSASWRKRQKKKVEPTGLKLSTTKKRENQSRPESENELQSEFGIVNKEDDDEATNFTSGMATPSHGYTLRERINGSSSRPTSPWLTKMTTKNYSRPSSRSSCVTSQQLLGALTNLKLRVENAVEKNKKNNYISIWDYTYYKGRQIHLVDEVLKTCKYNFGMKYNKIIAESLYGPCKHLNGDFEKFEKRCYWLAKRFIETVSIQDSSAEEESDEDNDGGGAHSDSSEECQNQRSSHNDPRESEDDDPELVDLVTDADDASNEDEFQPTSHQSSSQPAPFYFPMEPKVILETCLQNGLEKELQTSDVASTSNGTLLNWTKDRNFKVPANIVKYTEGETPKMSSKNNPKPSTSKGETASQQQDFLIDESSSSTMDFSLQVSDPEEDDSPIK